MDKISEHFTPKDVDCNCGCGYSLINRELLDMLEEARKLACVKFIINSWCRCQKYNDNLPNSVPNSAHIRGLAVDISAKLNKQIILKSLRQAGFKRIGIAKTFIHVDIDPNKPQKEWNY